MTDLYLIAHKVRGEPAFDIAEHMTCPKCNGGHNQCYDDISGLFGCTACDDQGHWWIIPTSGHRAFPYWDMRLGDLIDPTYHAVGPMPPALRDHYLGEREAAIDLIKVLGIIHAPLAPIKRRF